MASETFPGAEQIPASRNSGSMLGGVAHAIAHSTEGGSIEGAVAAYRGHGGWPTLTVDLNRGRIVQHLSPRTAARALQNDAGGVETNRHGSVCIQVEFVANAARPFTGTLTATGHATLQRVISWCESWGVPRTWPMGQPLAYGPDERQPGRLPAAYGDGNGNRASHATWVSRAGWYAHSQVPENDHGDPGRIDIGLWTSDQRGFLMALTDAEQTEALTRLRNIEAVLRDTYNKAAQGGSIAADARTGTQDIKTTLAAQDKTLGSIGTDTSAARTMLTEQSDMLAAAVASAIDAATGGSVDQAVVHKAVHDAVSRLQITLPDDTA